MSPARSSVPLERDAKGARISMHGEGGYKRGCGCEVCLKGHADAETDRRAVRSSKTPASARRAAAQPGRRGGMAAEDVREVTVTVHLSEHEAAAYWEHVAGLGDSGSGFGRDTLMAAIGYEDDARRPARPRPNRKHTETEGQQS